MFWILLLVPRTSLVWLFTVSAATMAVGQSGLLTTPVVALTVRWQNRMVLARMSRS